MEENKNNNPGFWDKYGLLILLGVLKMPFAGFVLVMIVFYAIYNPIFGPDPIDDSGAVEYRDTLFSVCNDSTEVLFYLSTRNKITLKRNNVTFFGNDSCKRLIGNAEEECYYALKSDSSRIPNPFRILDKSPSTRRLGNMFNIRIFIDRKGLIGKTSIMVDVTQSNLTGIPKPPIYESCEIYNITHNHYEEIPFKDVNSYFIK